MKNALLIYFIYGVMNLIVLDISLKYLILSFMEVDYFGVLIWSMIFSFELNDFITRHLNFSKYYPNFQEKWLKFFD